MWGSSISEPGERIIGDAWPNPLPFLGADRNGVVAAGVPLPNPKAAQSQNTHANLTKALANTKLKPTPEIMNSNPHPKAQLIKTKSK